MLCYKRNEEEGNLELENKLFFLSKENKNKVFKGKYKVAKTKFISKPFQMFVLFLDKNLDFRFNHSKRSRRIKAKN